MFYTFYEEAKRNAILELNNRQLLNAKQAAKSIEENFQHWVLELENLAEFVSLKSPETEAEQIIKFYYNAHQKEVGAVTRVNERGIITYTFPDVAGIMGTDLSRQEHMAKILRTHQPVLSNVFQAVQGFEAVALHVPVFNGGEFEGTVGILLNFREIAGKYLADIKIGRTGYAWMVDQKGIELYCPVPGHVGRSVYDNCKDWPSILAMADRMLQGRQGVTTYTFDRLGDQSREIFEKQAVYLPIRVVDTFWSIVVASSEDEALSTLVDLRNRLVFLFALLIIGGTLFTYHGLKAWGIVREDRKRRLAEEALRESEERFRTLIEEAPDAFFAHDPHGNIIQVNERACTSLGYSRPELLDMNVTDIEQDSTGVNVEALWNRVAGGHKVMIEGRHRRKDGATFPTEVTLSAFKVRGELVIFGFARDITERKATEDALRKSEADYRLLVENQTDLIVKVDLEGRFLFVSPSYCTCFGKSEEELLGKPFMPQVHEEDREPTKLAMESLYQPPYKAYVEQRALTRDGWRWLAWADTAVLDANGEVVEIIGVGRDITEKRLAEEELRRSLEERELLIKEIHHRVKNNLQVTISLLNLQAAKENDSRVSEALRISQNRVVSMALVHEALYRSDTLTRIDLNGYLNGLVENIAKSYALDSRKTKIEVSVPEHYWLTLDQAAPCGLVVNELISNSIKYAFPGERTGAISISAETRPDGQKQIVYRDDGVGLPENLDWRNSGTLGLSLVFNLIENQLQGRVAVNRGNGTEFVLTFPG
jgi:two-component system sensor kinase